MKICHTLLCMNPGGAEKVVATLSNYWVKNGKEIDIIIFVGENYPIFYKLDPRIKIHKLDLYGESKNIFEAIIRSYRIIKRLIKIYKDINPDVIIAHGNREITLATISSIFTKTKLVGYIHNDQSKFYKDKSMIWRILERIIYPLTNKLIIMDNVIKNNLPFFSQKKSIEVNNPVDDDYYSNDKLSETKDIIHVGSFIKRKNQACLIKAFGKIQKKHNDTNLILIGEGPEKKNCEQLTKDLGVNKKVNFVGNTENIKDYLKKSSLFIMPSYSEGMSIAILESLAVGLPLIATNFSPFHKKITLNGKNGYLVNVNDESDMAEKIDLILKDDELRYNMSEVSKRISKEYSVEKISEKWDEIFREV